MNRLIVFLCIFASLINLAGCRHEPSTHTICLLDISKSITQDGLKFEFKAVDEIVDELRRGDRLTIIPITGDALSDTPGHILRFTVPTERAPYDHDLVVFRQNVHKQIGSMRDAALSHPASRTDILGTLDLAKEEFTALQKNDHQAPQTPVLVILSDFIEDDGAYRFASDTALASDVSAQKFANQLQKESSPIPDGAKIQLDSLESKDLHKLTSQRQKAIREFWKTYIAHASWARM